MDRRLAVTFGILSALTTSAVAFYYVPGPAAIVFLIAYGLFAWASIPMAVMPVIVFVPFFAHPKTMAGFHFPLSEWLLGMLIVGIGLKLLTSAFATVWGRTWVRSQGLTTQLLFPTEIQIRRLVTNPFRFPAIVFVTGATISTILAAERGLAARELLEVVVEPILVFSIILLFTPSWTSVRDHLSNAGGALASTVNRRASYAFVLGVIVALTGLAPSLMAFGQIVTHQHVVPIAGAFYERVPGPYGSPDNLGLLLDRCIPMALAFLVVVGLAGGPPVFRGTGRRPLSQSGSVVGLALVFLCMCVALLMTFVLGAWIGSGVGGLTILAIRFRPGAWLAIFVLAIAVAALALGLGKAHSVTAGRRIDIWQSAVHMIRDHPIFGIGPDNFLHYYAPVHGDNVSPGARSPSGRCAHGLGYMEPAAHSEPCQSHPHNLLLDLWLSTGVIGLCGFTWLLYVFFRQLWEARMTLTRLPALLGCLGATIAALLHGLVDNGYFLIDLSMVFWVMLSIVALYASEAGVQDVGTAAFV